MLKEKFSSQGDKNVLAGKILKTQLAEGTSIRHQRVAVFILR